MILVGINGSKDSGSSFERVWLSSCHRVPQPGPGRLSATAKKCKPINIDCWKVRTLLDLQSSTSCPECRSVLVNKKLQRYEMRIMTLSDTTLVNEGQYYIVV